MLDDLLAQIPRLTDENLFSALPDVRLTARGNMAMSQPATLLNVQAALDLHLCSVRMDMMTKIPVVSIAGTPVPPDAAWSVVDMVMTRTHLSDRVGIAEAVKTISLMNGFHPAEEYIRSATWDGRDHISTLVDAMPVRDPTLTKVYLRRWLIQAVEAARGWRERKSQKEFVLVLAGGQGLYKTTFVRSLAPPSLTRTGVTIDFARGSDSIHQATTVWIAEFGELAEHLVWRKGQGAFKNFLSCPEDVYRMPYARTAITWPRATVYAGTVNYLHYGRDSTGTRRYWSVHVTDYLPSPAETVDLSQLWAQANYLWEIGETYTLTAEEESLRLTQSTDYEESDPVEDALQTYWTEQLIETTPRAAWVPLTFSQICRLCEISPQPSLAHRVSAWLNNLGIERQSRATNQELGLTARKAWLLPIKRNSYPLLFEQSNRDQFDRLSRGQLHSV